MARDQGAFGTKVGVQEHLLGKAGRGDRIAGHRLRQHRERPLQIVRLIRLDRQAHRGGSLPVVSGLLGGRAGRE